MIPELAYAVGLITSDGSLSKDGRHIVFTSTDKDLVKIFLKCIHKTNRINTSKPYTTNRKPSYRSQIGDVAFYRWLLTLGLTPHKSLTIGELKIPDEYYIDFLRGHLDGDGSIIYYKDYYNTHLNPKYIYDRLFVYLISASEIHVKWLQKRITFLLGIKGAVNYKKNLWVLKFSTKEAKIFLNKLYYKKNLPCLKRKYLIAKPFLI